MSLIALDLINLLFSVMGYYTCYCPSSEHKDIHLPTITKTCCGQQSGATYSAILVRSDFRRRFELLLTWLKWTVPVCD